MDVVYTERRRFARYTRDIPVTYQTLAVETALQCPHCGHSLVVSGQGLEHLLLRGAGRSQTLSMGGMAFRAQHGLAPGKELLLQFPMGRDLVSLRSKVVLCHRLAEGVFMMAVEFIDMNEAELQMMADYFAENLLKEARERNTEETQHPKPSVEPEEEPEEATAILPRPEP